jgi:hypothetical protein
MFGSQVLETAIGLVLMFFITALAASSIVEIYSRFLSKRSKDLEKIMRAMVAGGETSDQAGDLFEKFKKTSVYEAAKAAAGRSRLGRTKSPSYLPAKAFADAIAEMLAEDGAIDTLPDGLLKKRLKALVAETRSDLIGIKAGLERWFDDTMGRLEGAYKRWATVCVAVVGLVLAVAGNASTFDVAKKLWHDPVTRQAVAATANRVAEQPPTSAELESVAETTDKLKELALPVGWDAAAKDAWSDWRDPWNWPWSQWGTALGWVLTGLLVMLGAPFWFDLLTRLASLRSTGSKPPTAGNDDASATSILLDETNRGYSGIDHGSFEATLKKALGLPTAVTPENRS